jgi:hypothetical protein
VVPGEFHRPHPPRTTADFRRTSLFELHQSFCSRCRRCLADHFGSAGAGDVRAVHRRRLHRCSGLSIDRINDRARRAQGIELKLLALSRVRTDLKLRLQKSRGDRAWYSRNIPRLQNDGRSSLIAYPGWIRGRDKGASIVNPIDTMQPSFCLSHYASRILDIYFPQQENPDGLLKFNDVGRTTDLLVRHLEREKGPILTFSVGM